MATDTQPVRFHPTALALLDDPAKVRQVEGNPKNGDTDAIVRAIRRVGCYRPVYAWTQTGEILAGNHLYAALMELGADRIPIAWIDAPTRDDAEAIVLGDNKIAERGRYDEGLLLEMLDRQTDPGSTGWEDGELEDLRHLLEDDGWGHRDPAGGDGDGDDDSMNPQISMRVSAAVFDAFRQLLDTYEGDDDAAKLAHHLRETGFLT